MKNIFTFSVNGLFMYRSNHFTHEKVLTIQIVSLKQVL